MYETTDLVIVAIFSALAGLIIGIGLYRSTSASADKVRELEKTLTSERESNLQYKSNVTQHYSQTASLLTDLTLKYKNIHDHLASGADQLCRDEHGHSLLSNSPLSLRIEEQNETSSNSNNSEPSIQPPLDYSPKGTETGVGQLAEDFGLDKIKHDEALIAEPVPGAFAAAEALLILLPAFATAPPTK